MKLVKSNESLHSFLLIKFQAVGTSRKENVKKFNSAA